MVSNYVVSANYSTRIVPNLKGKCKLLIMNVLLARANLWRVWILVESVEGSVEKFHTSGGDVVEFQLVVERLSVDAQ